MNPLQPFTRVDKIRSYKAQSSGLLPLIKPMLEEQMALAKAAKKTTFHIHQRQQEGSLFVFAIHANIFKATCRIYMMLPATQYFEAVFFDPHAGKYHLFDWHFFQRYAERMSITHFSHPDMLMHYAEHNTTVVFGDRKKPSRQPRGRKIYAVTKQGRINAEQNSNVISYHTFISTHGLSRRQRRQCRSLHFKLKRSDARMNGQ